jgi:hypothetical protein
VSHSFCYFFSDAFFSRCFMSMALNFDIFSKVAECFDQRALGGLEAVKTKHADHFRSVLIASE